MGAADFYDKPCVPPDASALLFNSSATPAMSLTSGNLFELKRSKTDEDRSFENFFSDRLHTVIMHVAPSLTLASSTLLLQLLFNGSASPSMFLTSGNLIEPKRSQIDEDRPFEDFFFNRLHTVTMHVAPSLTSASSNPLLQLLFNDSASPSMFLTSGNMIGHKPSQIDKDRPFEDFFSNRLHTVTMHSKAPSFKSASFTPLLQLLFKSTVTPSMFLPSGNLIEHKCSQIDKDQDFFPNRLQTVTMHEAPSFNLASFTPLLQLLFKSSVTPSMFSTSGNLIEHKSSQINEDRPFEDFFQSAAYRHHAHGTFFQVGVFHSFAAAALQKLCNPIHVSNLW